MSKCPFWSTGKMTVKCYDECPMYPDPKGYEVCPFKEYLDSASINIKDNIDKKFNYSNDDIEEDIYQLVGALKDY